MNWIKKFIKWWKSFEVQIDKPNDPDGWNPKITSFQEEKEKSWCPLCGYAGTADDLRCHLLNHHK